MRVITIKTDDRGAADKIDEMIYEIQTMIQSQYNSLVKSMIVEELLIDRD